MSRQVQKFKKRVGLAPGSLVHIGKYEMENVKLSLYKYNEKSLEKLSPESLNSVFANIDQDNSYWLNIDGLNDLILLKSIKESFNLHPLTMEDIADTGQKPKVEIDGKNLIMILKMISWNEKEEQIDFEQVSFILRETLLITLQERPGDVFAEVRKRLQNEQGRLRKLSSDYLLYALLDALIDSYFILLGRISEKLEELEKEVISNPGNEVISLIHHFKRDILFLRKSIWYLRQVISSLARDDYVQFTSATKRFLPDLHDNTIQVIDTVENYREIVSGLLDIYLSSLSNRMNQVMKVLTIFASIFIPLTFLAGVYGMNFRYMPELEWKYAYPVWWFTSIIVTLLMVMFFKKKKWF